MHFQNSLHFGKRLLRFGNACADGLGTVHAGSATETEDTVTEIFIVQIQSIRYIFRGRIGTGLVIDRIGDAGISQCVFQTSGQTKSGNSLDP